MPGKQMREASAEVQQYIALTLVLIDAASSYAASTERDPETSALIRQLIVLSSSLNAALGAVQSIPMGFPPPPATPMAAPMAGPPPRP